MKPKKKQKPVEEATWEYDMTQPMGILPDGVSLTQNIGCVSTRIKKPDVKAEKKNNNE